MQPVNLAAAALIAQFVFVVILMVGSIVVRLPDHPDEVRGSPSFMGAILLLAVITLGALMLSDDLAAIWRPVYANLKFTAPSLSTGFLIVFFADALFVWFLIWLTGGSTQSPFTPVLFMIPTLAIFLREPLGRVLFYVCSVGVVFIVTLGQPQGTHGNRIATGWVALTCLALTTHIGFITRPG